MDVMLHKRCAKFVYVIPEGLRELMSDISREVIRSQPKHIYTFIADYLDALMITRENARVAARLVDSIIRIGATTVELLQQTGMTRQEADRMASIIQSAFKQYMAARRTSAVEEYVAQEGEDEMDEEQDIVSTIIEQYGDYIEDESSAAEIIQRAFRAFKLRHDKEKQLLSGMIDWRVAARSAIYLYRKTGVTYEEANRAATLIKAAYKGYYTRRIMKRLVDEGKILYGDEAEELEEQEVVEYEEVEFEEMEELPIGPTMKDYLALLRPEIVDTTLPVSDVDVTSSSVAESIVDDLLSLVPTESEPDQATATSWTEGMAADQTYADDMDAETAEYLRMHEDVFEEHTYTSGAGTTTDRSSLEEGRPTTEGAGTTAERSSFEARPTTEETIEAQELPGDDAPEIIVEATEEAQTESVGPLSESEKIPESGDTTEPMVNPLYLPSTGRSNSHVSPSLVPTTIPTDVSGTVTESAITTDAEMTDGEDQNA